MTDVLVDVRRTNTAVVRLNRPTHGNSVTPEVLLDLQEAIRELNDDDSIDAIVLTGTGSVFCAGADIRHMFDLYSAIGEEAFIDYQIDVWWPAVQATARLLWSVGKPLVAALNGAVTGGGLDFALMCDLRVASTTARFAESYASLGMLSVSGGAFLLPNLIGLSRAFPLLVSGTLIDAEHARDFGLVDEVCDGAYLISQAVDAAARLASEPSNTFALTKCGARRVATQRFEEALRDSYATNVGLAREGEIRRRLMAVMEHYRPVC